MEVWKDIKNYEGIYQISNQGNVKSLDRFVNSHQGERLVKGKILTPTDNGHNYKIIGLSLHNHRTNYYVHRLVAEAFLEKPIGCDVINHKDYNRDNNEVENLEWLTQKENVMYSLPNRPETTKATNQYGKYIIFDKRYGSYVVKVWERKNKRKTYVGSYKSLYSAIEARDEFLKNVGRDNYGSKEDV